MSARKKRIGEPRLGQRIKWLKNGKMIRGRVSGLNQRMIKVRRDDGEILEMYRSSWGLLFDPEEI